MSFLRGGTRVVKSIQQVTLSYVGTTGTYGRVYYEISADISPVNIDKSIILSDGYTGGLPANTQLTELINGTARFISDSKIGVRFTQCVYSGVRSTYQVTVVEFY